MAQSSLKTDFLIESLLNMASFLNSETDIDSLLVGLSDIAKDACGASFASIFLVDESTNELYFKTALGEKATAIKSIRIPVGSGIVGWVAQHGESLVVNDAANDPRFFGDVDKQSSLKTKNLLAVPIIFEGKVIGVIEAGNKFDNHDFSEEDLEYLSIVASQAGIALKNAFLVSSLQNFHTHVIDILVSAIDKISEFGQGHCTLVARTATNIARHLGIEGKEYQSIHYGALLHDIGVLSTTDLKEHPRVGASMINSIEILKPIVPIVAYHHEAFDGSGYPNGISGKHIPIEARIVAAAEALEENSWNLEKLPPEKFDPNILNLVRRMSLG